MKPISALLLLTALFSSSIVFGQKNTLSLGGIYLPLQEHDLAHGSLSYYRRLTPKRSIGLKAMFSKDNAGPVDEKTLYCVANVDLVHRWVLAKAKRRTRWNLEAGISAACTFVRFPPVTYFDHEPTSSPEQDLENEKYYREVLSKKHWVEPAFFAGLASAANWEIAITRHFGLGVGTTLNVYFSREDGWGLLPMPNVNAAYSF